MASGDTVTAKGGGYRYTAIDLGTLPGCNWAEVDAINDQGQVLCTAGVRHTDDPNIVSNHLFLWEQGRRSDLGLIGRYPSSRGISINSRGQVLGITTSEHSLFSVPQVFLWQNGTAQDLRHLNLPGVTPMALSDQGEIVGGGVPDAKGTRNQAFLWKSGHAKYLDLPSLSVANGVYHSSRGAPLLIVGDAGDSGFLWRDGQITKFFAAGGSDTHLFAVNAHGQAVGHANLRTGHSHAILCSNGKVTDLGPLVPHYDSHASAINDQGHIVGWTTTTPVSLMHAVLWQEGRIVDLNSEIDSASGITLNEAQGINNKGEIICNGSVSAQSQSIQQYLSNMDSSEYQHAFLLVPTNK